MGRGVWVAQGGTGKGAASKGEHLQRCSSAESEGIALESPEASQPGVQRARASIHSGIRAQTVSFNFFLDTLAAGGKLAPEESEANRLAAGPPPGCSTVYLSLIGLTSCIVKALQFLHRELSLDASSLKSDVIRLIKILSSSYRCRVRRRQIERFYGLQGQNLALTVLCVPYQPDRGLLQGARVDSNMHSWSEPGQTLAGEAHLPLST